MNRSSSWKAALLWLALYLACMVATNHRLTILDDEGIILTAANQSASAALNTFIHGTGQHEHPPLSDVVLHAWLILTHSHFAWMRVFANVFYILGLLVLAACGRERGNQATWWAVLLFGTLWPFGYFYARVTGWYCFCFLLVSLVTYAYLLVLRRPLRLSWAAFTAASILLLWTNYFGPVLLLVLLLDAMLFHRSTLRKHLSACVASLCLILLSFVPLLRALLFDARETIKPASTPFLGNILKFGYSLFALMASVAVAPWFLPWSIPILGSCLVLGFVVLRHKESRRFAFYFLVLLVALLLANHLDLKRLLFTTPWMILALALAYSTASSAKRAAAISATLVCFTIGWIGIATGRHRALVNFYEPWSTVAEETAFDAEHGATIISNSTTYFFYLNQQLGLGAIPSHGPYLGTAVYQLRSVSILNETPEPGTPLGHNVVVVKGVDSTDKENHMADIETELRQLCVLSAEQRTTPDPAAHYKELLGPLVPIVGNRVVVERFRCPSVSWP